MYKGFQIIKRYSFVFPCPHYYLLFIFKRVKIKSKSQELLSLNFDCLISTCVSIFWCTFWMPPNKQINTSLTIKQPHHYWPIERCLNWTSNHIPLNTPEQWHSFSLSHYVLSFSCLSLKSNLWEQFIKLHCLMSINCSGL